MSCPSATARPTGGEGVFLDGFDLVLHPPLCHCLQTVQFQPDHRAQLLHQRVQSADLNSPDATTTVHHNKEQSTGCYRLVEDPQ